jgi:acetylornithine deacetylase
MLGALVRLAEERASGRSSAAGPRPTVVLACTVNEEHGFSGAKGVCRIWSDTSSQAAPQPGAKPIPPAVLKFLPRRPDAAVVAEPTELKIVVAHKGMIRWRCHAHGRAAHSSNPGLGDNAIYRMAPVVSLLERYSQEVLPTLGEHPLCGRRTLSVGTIAGGSGVNTVPDRCTIEIDHRLLPGDDPRAAWQRTVDYVSAGLRARRQATANSEPDRDARAGAALIEHEEPLMHSSGLSDAANGALAGRLSSILRGAIAGGERIGVPFGTNAAIISAAGVPTVVFGPGSIAQAHTADEWIQLDQLPLASEAIFHLMRLGLRSQASSTDVEGR